MAGEKTNPSQPPSQRLNYWGNNEKQLYWYPGASPGAELYAFRKKNIGKHQILLIKRPSNASLLPGYWGAPAGYVDSPSENGQFFESRVNQYIQTFGRKFVEEHGEDIAKVFGEQNALEKYWGKETDEEKLWETAIREAFEETGGNPADWKNPTRQKHVGLDLRWGKHTLHLFARFMLNGAKSKSTKIRSESWNATFSFAVLLDKETASKTIVGKEQTGEIESIQDDAQWFDVDALPRPMWRCHRRNIKAGLACALGHKIKDGLGHETFTIIHNPQNPRSPQVQRAYTPHFPRKKIAQHRCHIHEPGVRHYYL